MMGDTDNLLIQPNMLRAELVLLLDIQITSSFFTSLRNFQGRRCEFLQFKMCKKGIRQKQIIHAAIAKLK